MIYLILGILVYIMIGFGVYLNIIYQNLGMFGMWDFLIELAEGIGIMILWPIGFLAVFIIRMKEKW